MRYEGRRGGVAFGVSGLLLAAALLAAGCGAKFIAPPKPSEPGAGDAAADAAADAATGAFVGVVSQKSASKVDLLLMIDNSISMADKQEVLKDAVPRLVGRLVSPYCVDPSTGAPSAATTPADPSAACPSPLVREFRPVRNLHIGVITSSTGGHGSTTLCVGNDAGAIYQQEQNDHGWLIAKRPRYMTPATGLVPDAQGFLNWNPDTHPDDTVSGLDTTFQAMTLAVGEFGCGLESQLEAVYRFLADPKPYDTIATQNCPGSTEPCAVPQGEDSNLLAQRAAFLRPDSLVGVVMLTDENDCSIRESGQYYYAARDDIILPHGSTECVTNPNDPCCYSCSDSPPPGCVQDPSCSVPTPRQDDQPNLRCFHQLQRFGKDFLYPTARYVNALTKAQICTSRGDLDALATCPDLDGDGKADVFTNPLFNGGEAALMPRDPSLVFLSGIVGVPWQDLQAAQDANGRPYPNGELHYRTATQLSSDGIWSVILGNDTPANGAPPIVASDALMVESKDPRGGLDGENPPQPTVGTNGPYLANKVNGHEWVNSDQDDLQYACIFKLAQSRDCAQLIQQDPAPGCDCKPGKETDNNPLCQASSGAYSTDQGFAKAYPGLRELQVLKDIGDNATVASICARNLTDASAQDYGYGPAIDGIVERIKRSLAGTCFPRQLTPVKDPKTGKVGIPCAVLEVRPGPAMPCSGTTGRSTPDPKIHTEIVAQLTRADLCGAAGKPSCDQFYACQIAEASTECHQNVPPTETGWCYVDPAVNPDDDQSLVAACPASDRRLLRFVDPLNDTPAMGAIVLLVCE